MILAMSNGDDDRTDGAGPVGVLPPVPPLAPEVPLPPPPQGEDGDGDGDQDGVHVHVAVTVFGKHRAVTLFFPEMPDEQTLAEELYGAASAVARLHGRGVWFEMERRCAEPGTPG